MNSKLIRERGLPFDYPLKKTFSIYLKRLNLLFIIIVINLFFVFFLLATLAN